MYRANNWFFLCLPECHAWLVTVLTILCLFHISLATVLDLNSYRLKFNCWLSSFLKQISMLKLFTPSEKLKARHLQSYKFLSYLLLSLSRGMSVYFVCREYGLFVDRLKLQQLVRGKKEIYWWIVPKWEFFLQILSFWFFLILQDRPN